MTPSASYPRPDFQRSPLNWASLDGPWGFTFDDQDAGISELWHQKGLPAQAGGSASHSRREIKVPFAFQTTASGIDLRENHEVIWYERAISDIRSADEIKRGHRLLVRFGAVDYECSVWVEGRYVGGHRGGHVPFDIDVTDAVQAAGDANAARLTVRVRDSLDDLTQLRGKQSWRETSWSIWYTATSGIWLSVWLESVPRMRIGSSSDGTILRSDGLGSGLLHATVAVLGRPARSACSVEIEARIGGQHVSITKKDLEKATNFALLDVSMKVPEPDKLRRQDALYSVDGCLSDSNVALWAPEHPALYDLTIRLYDPTGEVVDEIETTTGMRNLSWQNGDGTFCLNRKPYFQSLVLDQGYWADTGMTPPSPEALKQDIELSMKMGFNGCRKHQKVEDPLFLYWADRLGYLVWGEIASSQAFNAPYVGRFDAEWMEAVRRDINHPCVVTWTPANESWGYPALEENVEQRNHIRSVYYMTKTLDPSRPINDNCGWQHVLTDLTTYHDYADHEELAKSCSKLEGGILAPKNGNIKMFLDSITDESTVLDAAQQHVDGAPIICTEFGGVNIAPADKETKGDNDWGYTTAKDSEDLLLRLEKLVMAVVKGGYTCGYVYTQLTDIEQEVNGLYTIDRRAKISPGRVKAINDAAKTFYYDHIALRSPSAKTIADIGSI